MDGKSSQTGRADADSLRPGAAPRAFPESTPRAPILALAFSLSSMSGGSSPRESHFLSCCSAENFEHSRLARARLCHGLRSVGELTRIEIPHFANRCLAESFKDSRHACACLRHAPESAGETLRIELLHILSGCLA